MLNYRGHLIIHTLFHKMQDFEKWWYAGDITHVSFLSRKTVKKISDIFNLKIIKITDTAAVLKKNYL